MKRGNRAILCVSSEFDTDKKEQGDTPGHVVIERFLVDREFGRSNESGTEGIANEYIVQSSRQRLLAGFGGVREQRRNFGSGGKVLFSRSRFETEVAEDGCFEERRVGRIR